jgi:hypothetical protein
MGFAALPLSLFAGLKDADRCALGLLKALEWTAVPVFRKALAR